MKIRQLLVVVALAATVLLPSAALRAPAAHAASLTISLAITPSSQPSCLGDDIQVIATPGAPVYGSDHLTLQDDGNDMAKLEPQSDGTYQTSYSTFLAGDHKLVVYGDLDNGEGSPVPVESAVSHTWIDSVLTLSPSGTSSVVGSPHQLTASINCALTGTVTYDITGPGAAPSPLMSEILAGTTSTAVSYTSVVPGTDSITASLLYGEGDVLPSNTVTQVWKSPPPIVRVSRVSADPPTLCRSRLATVTAVATQDGAPLPDAQVRFVMSLPGAPTLDQTMTTDSAGTARVTYTRSSAGDDSISTTVVGSAAPAAMTVIHWQGCPVSITLGPVDHPTPVATNFTATAIVTKNGSPLSALTVRFHSAQPGQSTVTPPSAPITDASGSAPFTYQRLVAGTDTVFADVTVDGIDYEATLAHRWVAATSPTPTSTAITIALAPAGTTSAVGSQFTATATVLDTTNSPVVRALVKFSAVMTGDSARTGSGLTDAAGHVMFGWTRHIEGTDTLTASVRLDAVRSANRAIKHYWKASAITNGSLHPADPSPVPGETDTAVGSGCPAGARVELSVDGRSAGAGSADAQGRFAIPFRMPGVAVGRHQLLASCGSITVSAALDYVLSASDIGTSGAAVVTTAAVLAFFLLLGLQLVRPRMTNS